MIKSRRIRWEGYVAFMGRRVVHTWFIWEGQKEGDHQEDLGIGGSIILKWILET
jgi:hypothetical protein